MIKSKPFCPIVNKGGEEIITLTIKALNAYDLKDEAKNFKNKIAKCDNQNEVLKVILEYVTPCTEQEYENLMISIKNHQEYAKEKPLCPWIGANGNIFNIMALTQKTLRENNQEDKVKEVYERVISSHSYDKALAIMMEYVTPCSLEEYEEEKETHTLEIGGM